MDFDRRPANLKGHVLSALFRVAGGTILGKSLERDAQRIESSPRRGVVSMRDPLSLPASPGNDVLNIVVE